LDISLAEAGINEHTMVNGPVIINDEGVPALKYRLPVRFGNSPRIVDIQFMFAEAIAE
jgi:hypothetical protein